MYEGNGHLHGTLWSPRNLQNLHLQGLPSCQGFFNWSLSSETLSLKRTPGLLLRLRSGSALHFPQYSSSFSQSGYKSWFSKIKTDFGVSNTPCFLPVTKLFQVPYSTGTSNAARETASLPSLANPIRKMTDSNTFRSRMRKFQQHST